MSTAAPTPARWGELLKVDLRLRNFDIAFVFFGIIYAMLIHSTHLPLSPLLAKMFLIKALQIVGGVYLVSIAIILFRAARQAHRFGMASLRDTATQIALVSPYWSLSFLFLTLRRALVILGAIYFFVHLKHLVLWINTQNNDLYFWDLDRKLHFGIQPNIFAMEFIGQNQNAAVLLDWLYIKYFDYKLIVSFFFLTELTGRKLSDSYFFAYSLLWFLGGLAYLVMPADGPCYAVLTPYSIDMSPQKRAHIIPFPLVTELPQKYIDNYVEAKIPTAKFYQLRLWEDRQKFLQGHQLPGVFYGISAMPSLHVAAVTFIAVFLFQTSSLMGAIGVLYAIITFIGSIFLQWHYAIDGYIGCLLGLLIAFVSLKLPALSRSLRRENNSANVPSPIS